MHRISRRIVVAAALSFLVFGAKSALAVNEVCFEGTTGAPGAGECNVTASHTIAGGVYAVDRALHISGAGELKVTGGAALTLLIQGNTGPAPQEGLLMDGGGKITGDSASGTSAASNITIIVANGDIVLDSSGAAITADNTKGPGCGAASAGNITITANGVGATISTEDGTVISASGLNATKTGLGTCSAGAINISAPNFGVIDIDGAVLSESGRSGTGNAQNSPRGGGPISIEAACNLTVSNTGKVSSRGQDPGAALVHLRGGCSVLIDGLVQSTGIGHVTPKINFVPSNLCNSTNRPDKPANSTGCVEIWGLTVRILRDGAGHNGEVNADIGGPGGSTGTSWIDIFGHNGVEILSAANPAVHANGNAGTNDIGGVITVKSDAGPVILNGLALQANALGSGGRGGTVDVEATGNVDLAAVDPGHVGGIVQAMGATTGGGPHGGHIVLFSQNNIVASSDAILNVTGRNPSDGVVDLQACNTIDFPPGTVIGAGTFNKTPSVCPPPVSFESYVKLPTSCPCSLNNCPV